MRILQVVSSSKNSGAERHVFLLTQMLLQRGHTVSVVCPPDGWLAGALTKAGIDVHQMEMRKGSSFAAHRKLFRLISRTRFDVVHTHLTRATYHAGLSAFLRRVPLVATVHVFSRDFIYRVLATGRSRLVAVSESLRSALVSAGIPASRIDVVYNGTDFLDHESLPGESVLAEFGLSCHGPTIGLVGRISKEKGHLIALGAAPEVVEKHPGASFVFVGRLEPHFADEFNAALADSEVKDSVILTGPREDVPRLMDAMDIVILPSEKETFGLVAIEAMALGKPVIATRTGGLTEVIQDQITGLLIEQDVAQLVSAIDSLLLDDTRRLAMGQKARRWVEEHFSHTRMVERLEAVYRTAAGGTLPSIPVS